MKKEDLIKFWEEYCIAMDKEFSFKKETNGNVTYVYAEVKWSENGIEEIRLLNLIGLENILDGEKAEYEKYELDTFNKDGKVDIEIPIPMRLDLNSYITSIPIYVVRNSDNECIINYPNMDELFNNKKI